MNRAPKALFNPRYRPFGVVLAALALCGACDGGRAGEWERDRIVLGPIPLHNQVAYIDSARDRVIVLDMRGEKPTIRATQIGRNARFATINPKRDRLLVLTRGTGEIESAAEEESPALWVIDVEDPKLSAQQYRIDSPFDRMVISADGATGVAYFSQEGPDDTGFFQNPNELAIVNLESAPSDDNPSLKTIRSFGSVPTGILLSPPMVIPGAEDDTPRVFAFVLAEDNLTVFDASHPTRNEVSVRLESTGESVRPEEIVFEPASSTAYVRSRGANDILELAITADSMNPGSPNDNDFRPRLTELGAGGGPADIAVYDDIGGRRTVLAATPSTGELVIIDAKTAAFKRVSTAQPIDRIVLFPAGEGEVPRVALLASLSTGSPVIHLLSLDNITDELVPTTLRRVELDQPVLDVMPVPGRESALLVHSDDRAVLGLLDIAVGSLAPVLGVGQLDSFAFSTDGNYLVGATNGVRRVGFLKLENLHPTDILLDEPAATVMTMPNGNVFIDHNQGFGLATVLPGPDASREEALVITGFMLADLLNEEF